MPEYWNKLNNWVDGLPWYFKWVGFILLGVAMLAVLVSWIFREGPKTETLQDIDDLHKDETIEDIAVLEKEAKKLKDQINKKKIEIATSLNQGHNIDAKTLLGREKIMKASTMEELDALQKELGL